MTVYLILKLIDTEYGNREVEAVFQDEKKAKAYVKKNQFTKKVWYSEKPIKGLIIQKMETKD